MKTWNILNVIGLVLLIMLLQRRNKDEHGCNQKKRKRKKMSMEKYTNKQINKNGNEKAYFRLFSVGEGKLK